MPMALKKLRRARLVLPQGSLDPNGAVIAIAPHRFALTRLAHGGKVRLAPVQGLPQLVHGTDQLAAGCLRLRGSEMLRPSSTACRAGGTVRMERAQASCITRARESREGSDA